MKMEYEIRTLIKQDEQFVPVEDSPRIEDPNYIDGAIIWRIGPDTILSEKEWDLVDQLWAYIINILPEFQTSGTCETCFPDQPLLLRIKAIDARMVEVTVGESRWVLSRSLVLRSLLEGANTFFERIRLLVPQFDSTWQHYLAETARLRA